MKIEYLALEDGSWTIVAAEVPESVGIGTMG